MATSCAPRDAVEQKLAIARRASGFDAHVFGSVISDDGTDSAWAPPLWIPYSLMTAGMSLLTLRLVMQLGQAFGGRRGSGA
jgi:hypothetical protein